MTAKESSFRGQIESWFKEYSKDSTRMTPVKILSNGGCVA